VIFVSCPNYKRICEKLVISDSVTFANGTLTIDLPANSYVNNEKYCIVVAQNVPTTTTIDAPVVITIGGDATTTYPLVNCDCTNVTACSINTRTRYSVFVRTNVNGGSFVLKGKVPCSRCANNVASLPIQTAGG
jgi:hypothetical protein